MGKKPSPGEPCSSASPQWLSVLQTFLPVDLHAYVWDKGLKALQSVPSLVETSCWPFTEKQQRGHPEGSPILPARQELKSNTAELQEHPSPCCRTPSTIPATTGHPHSPTPIPGNLTSSSLPSQVASAALYIPKLSARLERLLGLLSLSGS